MTPRDESLPQTHTPRPRRFSLLSWLMEIMGALMLADRTSGERRAADRSQSAMRSRGPSR